MNSQKLTKAGSLPLVLASGSTTRLQLLLNAGLDVIAKPATIDEQAIKQSLLAEQALPLHVALTLAELKAQRVGANLTDVLVLGSDQVLVCGGKIFDKPTDLAEARSQLLQLRNKKHELICGSVILKNGGMIWQDNDIAVLEMRDFSDEFLDQYLSTVGDKVQTSVGGYHIEGLGLQLFRRISGDFTTIMGLPMLPLLAFLREHQMIQV